MIKSMVINFHGEDIAVTMEDIDRTAQLVYEANSVLRSLFREPARSSWANTSEDVKDRVRSGVRTFMGSGFMATPAEMHEQWLLHMKNTGWIYGEVEDAELKTHPNIRPYAELPIEQHTKDLMFTVLVETIWLDITGTRAKVQARLAAQAPATPAPSENPTLGLFPPESPEGKAAMAAWADPDTIEG